MISSALAPGPAEHRTLPIFTWQVQIFPAPLAAIIEQRDHVAGRVVVQVDQTVEVAQWVERQVLLDALSGDGVIDHRRHTFG